MNRQVTPVTIPEDLQPGHKWRVPCVHGRWAYEGRARWWPVIGSIHEDAEIIGFPHHHYHVDLRFVAPSALTQFVRYHLRYALPLTLLSERAPQVRLRTYHQPWPDYPFLRDGLDYRPSWMEALEAAYAETRLTCARCPHRGIPLDGPGIQTDAQGNRTCPGHGLVWRPDGTLLRRLTNG